MNVSTRIGYSNPSGEMEQKTRLHALRQHQYGRKRGLDLVVLLLALLALAVVLPGCGSSSPPEEAERSQPAELSQPGPSSTSKPVPSVDEAWATAIAQDPSPSLATPSETMGFGHRIALTFDDGPDPVTTPAILDILRDNHLKATFFVIGARAEQYPELVERIAHKIKTCPDLASENASLGPSCKARLAYATAAVNISESRGKPVRAW